MEERKDEFLNAAEKLFHEKGVVNTTINAIVKEMHVAKGLFYYYFDSKEEVIDAISKRYIRHFKTAIQKAMQDSVPYKDRVCAFLDDSVINFRKLYESFHVQGKDIDLSILSNKSFEEAKASATTALTNLFLEGNEKQKLHISQPEKIAEILIGGIADLVSHANADVQEIQKTIKDLLKQIERGN